MILPPRSSTFAGAILSYAAVFLAATLSSINGQEPSREVLPEGCVRETWSLDSPSMKRPIQVAVLVPPGEARALPVLYAMHGRNAPYLTMTEMLPLRQFLREHPMLVVTFNGDDASGYINAPKKPDSQFTTFFFDELMPAIANRYQTNGQVAVTGFSMGGYGAFHYMLERPEAFSSVSAISGGFNMFAISEKTSPKSRERYESLLGPADANAADYQDVMLMPRLTVLITDGGKLPPILFVCGMDDVVVYESNREMAVALGDLNVQMSGKELRKPGSKSLENYAIDFEYRETSGGHDFGYWKKQSAVVAAFHWEHFQKANP